MTSLRMGTPASLPMRTEAEYTVQDCGLTAGAGSTLAVVEAGAELGLEECPVGVGVDARDELELLEFDAEPLLVGVGVTMATEGVDAGVVGEEVGVDDVDVREEPVLPDGDVVEAAVVEVPVANGSRVVWETCALTRTVVP